VIIYNVWLRRLEINDKLEIVERIDNVLDWVYPLIFVTLFGGLVVGFFQQHNLPLTKLQRELLSPLSPIASLSKMATNTDNSPKKICLGCKLRIIELFSEIRIDQFIMIRITILRRSR